MSGSSLIRRNSRQSCSGGIPIKAEPLFTIDEPKPILIIDKPILITDNPEEKPDEQA